jgi:hypothetical protein
VNLLIRDPLALSIAACSSFIVCATSARLARVNERPAMLYDAPATAIALRQAVKSPCNSCRVASGRPKNDLFIAIHLMAMSKKRKGAGIEPAPVVLGLLECSKPFLVDCWFIDPSLNRITIFIHQPSFDEGMHCVDPIRWKFVSANKSCVELQNFDLSFRDVCFHFVFFLFFLFRFFSSGFLPFDVSNIFCFFIFEKKKIKLFFGLVVSA